MPHDPTKAQDPYRMALLQLTAARNAPDVEAQMGDLATAQVHATLAVADAIRDQTQILLVELRQISGAA